VAVLLSRELLEAPPGGRIRAAGVGTYRSAVAPTESAGDPGGMGAATPVLRL